VSALTQQDGQRPTVTRIAAVSPRRRVTVTGMVRSAAEESIGTSPGFRCVIADGSGEMALVFLGHHRVAGLTPGRRCTAEGMACAYGERLVIWNPRYELEPADPPDSGEAAGGAADGGRPRAGRVVVIDDDPGLAMQLDGRSAVLTQRDHTG
jgi:hypothetical protein